eukprot:m.34608 g.34608  ORF g.34608 m.34608 type:complete len:76 (+) comp32001_c0_seq5:857-1084(+)
MTFTTQLKFSVKDSSIDPEKPLLIGSTVCFIKDIANGVRAKDSQLKLPLLCVFVQLIGQFSQAFFYAGKTVLIVA